MKYNIKKEQENKMLNQLQFTPFAIIVHERNILQVTYCRVSAEASIESLFFE